MKLPDALRQLNGDRDQPVSYQRFLALVQAGIVPASRNAAGTRWQISEADLPVIRACLERTAR